MALARQNALPAPLLHAPLGGPQGSLTDPLSDPLADPLVSSGGQASAPTDKVKPSRRAQLTAMLARGPIDLGSSNTTFLADDKGTVIDPTQVADDPEPDRRLLGELDRNKTVHEKPGDQEKKVVSAPKGTRFRLEGGEKTVDGVKWVDITVQLADKSIHRGWVKEHATHDTNKLEHVDLGRPIFGKGEGPRAEDVKQGGVGDCFLMAALASVAQQDPNKILDMFNPSPYDGSSDTVTVRFYKIIKGKSVKDLPTLTPEYVTINKSVATWVKTDTNTRAQSQVTGTKKYAQGAPWVSIVEKAYAAWPSKKAHLGLSDSTGYDSLSGGHSDTALMQITGVLHDTIKLSDKPDTMDRNSTKYPDPLLEVYDRVTKALKARGTLTISSKQSLDDTDLGSLPTEAGFSAGEPVKGGMVGKHEYSIVGASEDRSGKKFVHVRNPWGKFGFTYKRSLKNTGSDLVPVKDERGAVTKVMLQDLPKYFDKIGIPLSDIG